MLRWKGIQKLEIIDQFDFITSWLTEALYISQTRINFTCVKSILFTHN